MSTVVTQLKPLYLQSFTQLLVLYHCISYLKSYLSSIPTGFHVKPVCDTRPVTLTSKGNKCSSSQPELLKLAGTDGGYT